MALTASVKEELSRLDIKKSSVRKAEVSAMLRFAGGLHIISGRIVIEAEVDLASTARRLRQPSPRSTDTRARSSWSPAAVSAAAAVRGRVVRDGEALARQTGSWTAAAGPCAACPRPSSTAPPPTPRPSGAARSSPTAPDGAGPFLRPGGDLPRARVRPGAGRAARRLGIQAKAREVRGVDRVVIRDGDTIAALLTRMGAHDALMVWEERRMRKEVRATANRLANFDDANLRR